MAKAKNSTKAGLRSKKVTQRSPRRSSLSGTSGPAKSSLPFTSNKPKAKPHSHRPQQDRRPPFTPEDRILLIGEGDFSFSLSLLLHHAHISQNLTCTTNDSPTVCLSKYPQARANIDALTSAGHHIRHDVSVSRPGKFLGLPNHTRPKPLTTPDHAPPTNYSSTEKSARGWDVVIFNFPHVGGKSTDVNRQVRANQELLLLYFRAAVLALAPSGRRRIIVTLFEGEPYSLWNVRDLARHAGLGIVLRRSGRFVGAEWAGYRHARTLGNVIPRGERERGGGIGEDRGVEAGEEDARTDGDGDDETDGEEKDGDGESAHEDERDGKGGEPVTTSIGWRGEERAARMYIFEVEGEDRRPGTFAGGGSNGVELGKRKRRSGFKKGRESDDDESD